MILTTTEQPPMLPKQVAEYYPRDYVFAHSYHKRPELKHITDSMIEDIVLSRPEAYFEFGFDKVPEFKPYNQAAAKNLALRDPLSYIYIYGLHKNPEFRKVSVIIFESLSAFLGFKSGTEYKKNPKLFKEVSHVVEEISKRDPKYYVGSGLAEDEEFGRFFKFIGKRKTHKPEESINETQTKVEKETPKAAQINTDIESLAKIAQQLDAYGFAQDANVINDIVRSMRGVR